MECSATSESRFWIWIEIHPNLSMNFQGDSSSAYCKLVKVTEVMWCDRLIMN